jgi:hypothetical protein
MTWVTVFAGRYALAELFGASGATALRVHGARSESDGGGVLPAFSDQSAPLPGLAAAAGLSGKLGHGVDQS